MQLFSSEPSLHSLVPLQKARVGTQEPSAHDVSGCIHTIAIKIRKEKEIIMTRNVSLYMKYYGILLL